MNTNSENLDEKSVLEMKYEALALARGENIEQTHAKFDAKTVMTFPKNYPRELNLLMDYDIVDSYVRDGLAYAVDARGIALASEIGTPRYHRMYAALSDKLPPALKAETFLAGLNMAQRFDSIGWLPPHIRESGKCLDSVVEIGAFLGHKAIRCAMDFMKPGGIYHAIELMGDNYETLCANVQANNLDDVIKTHNIAISDADGEIEVFSKGRQRSGIVPIGNVGDTPSGTRRALKLSTFFKEQNIDTVDFCYITVNGAELKVLHGAEKYLEAIKFVKIVSKYDVDGEPVAPKCCDWLQQNGFVVEYIGDIIHAKNPGFEL